VRDYPIAIVGAGGIVNDAHLPAYRKAGFDVVGIYNVRAEHISLWPSGERLSPPRHEPDVAPAIQYPEERAWQKQVGPT
jgi:predicted dehydrogenase